MLKAGTEEAQGTPPHRQELFLLGEEGAEGAGNGEPLSDDDEVVAACTVVLCVRPAAGEYCCGEPFRVHGSNL